jgi:hypothetical protein
MSKNIKFQNENNSKTKPQLQNRVLPHNQGNVNKCVSKDTANVTAALLQGFQGETIQELSTVE